MLQEIGESSQPQGHRFHVSRGQLLLAVIAGAVLLAGMENAAQCAEPPATPNVVIILADDMGYSDLGCYGSEIQTPHLDALAAGGLRYTQFYNTARCWPTRSALMTGYFAQLIHRDRLPDLGGGGSGKRQAWAHLLPELLKQRGYRSYHSGKWHIDGNVLAGGFDRSYCLNDHNHYFGPQNHTEDDVRLPPVASQEEYSVTTTIADYAIGSLQSHAREHAGTPFLLYLAFTAPHFPLHAPQADIDRYRETYRIGWDEIRRQRHQRQTELGLTRTSLSEREESVGPPYSFPDAIAQLGPGEVNRPLAWESLTPEQQAFQSTKMAIHAAMIDRMDREIGRVLDQLKQMNVFDDTLILFLSDNGASAEIMVRGDGHDPAAPMGSAATYLCLGPGFSNAANTPFRRHKTWVHEGGISTPLIVHWPQGISEKGALRQQPGHVVDIVPTLLDLTGIAQPETSDDGPAPPYSGTSLLPTFQEDRRIPRNPIWWLHEGNRAIRIGDWKLVAAKDDDWALYDLAQDRAESQDLASTHPQQAQELQAEWDRQTQLMQELAARTAEQNVPDQQRRPPQNRRNRSGQ